MSARPVLADAQVVVCGGGTAGVFAAVAAAESGADTLLLESSGDLGGSAVGGLVTPMMSSRLPGGLENSYLSRRLSQGRAFDPLTLEIELERLCLDAGVRLLYGVRLCGAETRDRRVRAVTAASKGGLGLVTGRVFVDCTGDGDLCAFAGAEFDRGDPDTGANQPMSLRWLMGGVDMDRFSDFLDNIGRESGLPHTAYGAGEGRLAYAAVTDRGDWALGPLFREAAAKGDLEAADLRYWQAFGVPGRPDTLAMNHPEFPELTDASDPWQLTELYIRGREAIARQVRFCRRYLPGLEHAYAAQIAPLAGVRESRRVRTDAVLTARDILSGRKFPDRVAQSAYPVDVHGAGPEPGPGTRDDARPWFEVPYGCLTVRGFGNLLAAGRCVGADFTAQSALRIQPTCRVLGEAAGVAAAWSAQRGVPPSALKGEEIAAELTRRGAVFLA